MSMDVILENFLLFLLEFFFFFFFLILFRNGTTGHIYELDDHFSFFFFLSFFWFLGH